MKNWWNRFKYNMANALRGCYGPDQFSRFLLGASIFIYFLALIPALRLLYFVSMALIFYSMYRIFSKRYIKRQRENDLYLKATAGIRGFANAKRRHLMDRDTHKYFRCPKCHTYNRVPKGHGTIMITCPKCRTEFKRNSGKLK